MPGAIQELKIGPFSGGMNTHSDESAIADSEMVDCVNFDIDLDGSLLARPPWSMMFSTTVADVASPTVPYNFPWLLGTFVYSNIRMVFYQIVNATNATDAQVYIYYVDGANAGTSIKLTGVPANQRYMTAARYDNKVYVVPQPDSALGGFYYDLTTEPAAAVTAVAAMPGGNSAVFYKFAMWIGGGKSTNKSRVYYSALSDPTTWPGANFFDVAPGDGFAVQDMLLYQDNIIISKENSTYVLAYDSSPQNAIIRLINSTIGVKGPKCMVAYENSIFFLIYGQVYEMINYNFTRVSTKVFSTMQTMDQSFQDNVYGAGTFGSNWQYPVWMSNVGDRLVVRIYNTIYVYHLRVRAWTRWTSTDPYVQTIGPIMELERSNSNATAIGFKTYIAGTSLNMCIDAAGPGVTPTLHRYTKIIKFNDHFDSTTTENGQLTPVPVTIPLNVLTKIYDINLSHRFKRLMHWGVDAITGQTVNGTLFPFSVSFRNTWAQLAGQKWSSLNTWLYPLTSRQSVAVPVVSGGPLLRQFIRFPYSLRFRLLQFRVDMLYSGNTTDGPARLYTVTAFVGAKAVTPAATN